MPKINLNFKIWILIIFIILSIVMIKPDIGRGVEIKSVARDSPSYEAGLRQGMIITQINGEKIEKLEDFSEIVYNLFEDEEFKKIIIIADRKEFLVYTNSSLEITVSEISTSNIKLGLDLQGGARALIKPKNISLTQEELTDLIDITNERFNVFGISDIIVRPVSDLEGNNYMMVEIAGATPSDIEKLIGEQGKFEAKIGNKTVFEGGKEEVPYVCRQDATCSRITSCKQSGGLYLCRFEFSISLSEAAAQKHADITSELEVIVLETGERYLEEKLELYVDDVLADSLYISEGLKGLPTTQILISGSGSGKTRDEAITDTSENMKKLQTILITGGLPYQLEILKLDTISPALGKKFISYLTLAGFLGLLGVALIVFLRYRKIKISLAVLLTSFSEIIIILGVAAFIKWNLDLASIAGILITIGTGVDHQIVIVDESIRGEKEISISRRIKKAMFIIFGAYFTTLAALFPLYWAGAGLLRGFAFTTIIGTTASVLISRPAFAEIIKKFEKK